MLFAGMKSPGTLLNQRNKKLRKRCLKISDADVPQIVDKAANARTASTAIKRLLKCVSNRHPFSLKKQCERQFRNFAKCAGCDGARSAPGNATCLVSGVFFRSRLKLLEVTLTSSS
eukprot:1900706-Pleurochrysis_carterae.AAC.2